MGLNNSIMQPISVNSVNKRDLESIAVSENVFKRLYDNILEKQTKSETSDNENKKPGDSVENSENVKDFDDDELKRTQISEEKTNSENKSKDENLWEMFKEFKESKEEKRRDDEQELFKKFKKFATNTDSESGTIDKEQLLQKFEEFTEFPQTTNDEQEFFNGHKKFTADMNPEQKVTKTHSNDKTNHQQSTHSEEEQAISKEPIKDFVDYRNSENKADGEEGTKLVAGFNGHSNIKDEENKSGGLQSTNLESNRIGKEDDYVKNCASGDGLGETVNEENSASDNLQEKGSELMQEEEWMQKLLDADANHSAKNQLSVEGYNGLMKNIDDLLNKSRNSVSCNLAKAELLRCYQSNSVTSLKCQYAVDNFTNCVDDMTVRGKNKWLLEAPKEK